MCPGRWADVDVRRKSLSIRNPHISHILQNPFIQLAELAARDRASNTSSGSSSSSSSSNSSFDFAGFCRLQFHYAQVVGARKRRRLRQRARRRSLEEGALEAAAAAAAAAVEGAGPLPSRMGDGGSAAASSDGV
jgi:hypothetical protein